MKAVKFEGFISRLSSRQDKSISFGGASGREMSKDDFGYLRDLQGIELMVTLEPITGMGKLDYSETIELETAKELKSPSKRLKAVIYLQQVQQIGRIPTPSEQHLYYLDKMETILDREKTKLE